MYTTWETRSPFDASSRCQCRIWSTISPAVRLRTRPISPVAQNAQAIGQPAWVETQTALRAPWCGMSTLSMWWPSRSSRSALRVSIRTRLLAHRLDGGPAKGSRERVTKRPRQIGQFFEPALGAMRCVPTDLLRPVRRLPVLVEPDDKLVPRQLAYGGTTLGHRLERNGAIQDGTRSSARMSRSPRLHSAPVIARLPAGFTSSRRSHPAPAATCGTPSRISNVPCSVPLPPATDERSTP